jgi:DNA polymerase-3 subunit gamma/tau
LARTRSRGRSSNALASGRIAHAYLFAGPRGIGKTTTARCWRARSCARSGPAPSRAASARCASRAPPGRSWTCIEIDGASNRGIEEIRTLRENVKYTPARGKYKVYIIDEVHQLTEAAFNALLKNLEEPPPHIVFVLATTDRGDIPRRCCRACSASISGRSRPTRSEPRSSTS